MDTGQAPEPAETERTPSLLGGRSVISGITGGTLVGAAVRTGGFAARAARLAVRQSRNYPEVPTPRPSLPKLGSVFLEELAMLAMASIVDERALDREALARIGHDSDVALALYDSEGWATDPASFHQTPTAPADYTLHPERFLRIRYQHLRFDSGFEPRAGMPGGDRWTALEANRTCHAHVLEHRKGIRPWVVYLHGHDMGRPMDLYLADALHLHRKLGFNVIAPVLPLHGARHVDGEHLIDLDWCTNVHALAQCVWDVRRVLAWIRERGADSILVHGMSLGGYVTGLVVGLDPDLDGAVAGVPAAAIHAPITSVLGRNPAVRRVLQKSGIADERTERIHRVVTPTALPPLVPAEQLSIYAGLADRLATPSQPYRLWEHWGRPRIMWSQSSHAGTIISGRVRHFVRRAAIRSRDIAPEAEAS